jgi:4-hydroxybutyryl-CoA dehydratase/vinylacetyl-CoA-Delta-isomerase
MDQQVVAASADRSANPIRSGAEYVESLRAQAEGLSDGRTGRVDHPIIKPSINAVAKTYDPANEDPELASAVSQLTGGRVNRFLHISASPGDLAMQNKMQRRLGK